MKYAGDGGLLRRSARKTLAPRFPAMSDENRRSTKCRVPLVRIHALNTAHRMNE
jgi:hypothetical protein